MNVVVKLESDDGDVPMQQPTDEGGTDFDRWKDQLGHLLNKTIVDNDDEERCLLDDFAKLNRVYLLKSDERIWLACLYFIGHERASRHRRRQLDDARSPPSTVAIHKLIERSRQTNDSFLAKMRILLTEMLRLSPRSPLVSTLSLVQSGHDISSLLFAKHTLVFDYLFDSAHLRTKSERNTVRLRHLFRFGWLVFIYIKEHYPHVRHSLVNAHQLLICCLHSVYERVRSDDACRNIVSAPTESTLMLETLCKRFGASLIECKTIGEYHVRAQYDKLGLKEMLTTVSGEPSFMANVIEHCARVAGMYARVRFAEAERANRACSCCCLDERLFVIDSASRANDNDAIELLLPTCLGHLLNDEDTNGALWRAECDEKQLKLFDEWRRRLAATMNSSFVEPFCKSNETFTDQEAVCEELTRCCVRLYSDVLDTMLCNERSAKGVDSFKKHLGAFLANKSLHKGVFILCFEILVNFVTIRRSHKVATSIAIVDIDNTFKFPWSTRAFELSSYDLFPIVELFVRTTSTSPTSTPVKTLLSRQLVQFVGRLEETILTKWAWESDSTLWASLSKLKLNKEFHQQMAKHQKDAPVIAPPSTMITQLHVAFPLNEDVSLLQHLPLVPHQQPHAQATAPLSSPMLTATLKSSTLPQQQQQQQQHFNAFQHLTQSPSKQSPTITKVLSAAEHYHNQSMAASASSKVVARPNRLQNLTYTSTLFFRKFYSLAFAHLRQLVDILVLTRKLAPTPPPSSSKHGTLSRTSSSIASSHHHHPPDTPNLLASSSASIAQTPNLATSTTGIIVNSNNSNSNSCTLEYQQLVIKLVWNVFEYAICCSSSPDQVENNLASHIESLLVNRQVDQLLICAIYATCKFLPSLSAFSSSSSSTLQFQDIIAAYKTCWPHETTSDVYKRVWINELETPQYRDLIHFYNHVFVAKLKPYISLLRRQSLLQKLKQQAHDMSSSPTPRVTTFTHLPTMPLTQFSPRKVDANQHNVLVSPVKSTSKLVAWRTAATTTTATTGNPSKGSISTGTKSKLRWSMSEANPCANMILINDMIKRNEMKTRTSNKRLLTSTSCGVGGGGGEQKSVSSQVQSLTHVCTPSGTENGNSSSNKYPRLMAATTTTTPSTITAPHTMNINIRVAPPSASTAASVSPNPNGFLNKLMSATCPSQIQQPKSLSSSCNITKIVSTRSDAASNGFDSKSGAGVVTSNIKVTLGSSFARRLQDIHKYRVSNKGPAETPSNSDK